MHTYTTRQPRIIPIGTKEEVKRITDRLTEINNVLYIAANLIVADCVSQYWGKAEDQIPYLVHQVTVSRMEEELSIKIQELHQAGKTNEEKVELRKAVSTLKGVKEAFIRKVQKQELWMECREKSIKKTVERQFPVIPEDVLHQTIFRITQQILKNLNRMRAGTCKVPYFTKGFPIPFTFDVDRMAFYRKGENDICFDWFEGIKFRLDFGKDKGGVKKLVEQFLSKELDHNNLGDSTIKIDKHRERIYLYLVAKEPPPEPQPLNRDLCMGVDVGYNVLAYWGLSDFSDSGGIGDGKEVRTMRKSISERIAELSSSLKSAKGGHGAARKLRARRSALRAKERNYFQTLNRKLAKQIVDIAIKKRAGVIKIENTEFTNRDTLGKVIRDQNVRQAALGEKKDKPQKDEWKLTQFRFWSYAQLHRFIKQRAEKNSIEVVYVSHFKTSQVCHVCKAQGLRPPKENHEHLVFDAKPCGNRQDCPMASKRLKWWNNKTKKNFTKDQWVIDADKNAAFNIASSQEIVKENS